MGAQGKTRVERKVYSTTVDHPCCRLDEWLNNRSGFPDVPDLNIKNRVVELALNELSRPKGSAGCVWPPFF